MAGKPSAWPTFWAGLGLFVFSVLLVGVGVLLVVVPLAGVTIATGVQLPLGALAVLAIGLLLAAFLYASVVYGEAYMATLWATAPFLPSVAAVAVLVAYFALPWTSPGMPREASLYLGAGAALAVWIVSAAPLRGLACVKTAQTYSYGWLEQRAKTLEARIVALRQEASATTTAATAPSVARDKTHALEQADVCRRALESELGNDQEPPKAGLRYVSATGYLDLWRLVYKCEEALLIADDDVWLIKEAVYDDLRLAGSTIPNQDLLRAELKTAVTCLDPVAAQRYLGLGKTQAAATNPTPAQAGPSQSPLQVSMQSLQTALRAVSQALPHSNTQGSPNGGPEEDEKRRARAVLRDVRQAVNEERGAQWQGIVRARNRLLRTAFVAGIAAFLLLGLAILDHAPENALVGAVAFFLVGALFGLFARLYVEGQSESASDDYGLFEARLIALPILSGLAGVAGVFLVAIAAPALGAPAVASASSAVTSIAASALAAPATASAGSAVTSSLVDIFDLSNHQQGLIWAAVFGVTPELVLKQLQGYTNKMLKDLDNSQAGGASRTQASSSTQAAQ